MFTRSNVIKPKTFGFFNNEERKNVVKLTQTAISGNTNTLALQANTMGLSDFQVEALKDIVNRYKK